MPQVNESETIERTEAVRAHFWAKDRTYFLRRDEVACATLSQKVFGSNARLGRWHEKPRAGEVRIGSLRVRRRDPEFPVFGKEA